MMGKDPFERAKSLGLCVGVLHPPCCDLVSVVVAQMLKPQVNFLQKHKCMWLPRHQLQDSTYSNLTCYHEHNFVDYQNSHHMCSLNHCVKLPSSCCLQFAAFCHKYMVVGTSLSHQVLPPRLLIVNTDFAIFPLIF
jgi:hypothetical protein